LRHSERYSRFRAHPLANALSRSIFFSRSGPRWSISFVSHGPLPFVSHVPFAPHNRHSYSPQRYNPHLLQLFRRQRERHFTAQQRGRCKRDICAHRSVSIPFFSSKWSSLSTLTFRCVCLSSTPVEARMYPTTQRITTSMIDCLRDQHRGIKGCGGGSVPRQQSITTSSLHPDQFMVFPGTRSTETYLVSLMNRLARVEGRERRPSCCYLGKQKERM
jgi:hypothetical protein